MARYKLPQEWTIINDFAVSLIIRRNGASHKMFISSEDIGLVGQYRWCMCGKGYVWTTWARDDKKVVSMHRLVTKAPKGKGVDHINHNPLDNRGHNLRVCSQSENIKNRMPHRNARVPFKGVSFDSHLIKKRFAAKICSDGKYYHIGRYATAEEAAQAYDVEALKLHGEFALTNRSLGLL